MDEKVCPHCGHAIISWEFDCPGCDQIPKTTEAGKRILSRERRHRIVRILIAILFSAVVFTGLSYVIVKAQYNKVTQVQRHLNAMSSRVLLFQHGLRLSDASESEMREELKAQVAAWLDIEGPMLLEILHDYADYTDIRAQAIILITALFHQHSVIRDWAPESHAEFVRALERLEVRTDLDRSTRSMIRLVLEGIR